QRPALSVDHDGRRVRPRHGAVDRRSDGPLVDDRRDEQISVGRDVHEPTVRRTARGPREAPARAREDRAPPDVGNWTHAKDAVEVARGDADLARCLDDGDGRDERAASDRLAGAHDVPLPAAPRRADRERVIDGPPSEAPGHGERSAPTASYQRATAGT